MQLSEKRIRELAGSVAGSEPWSIGCVKFARLLEEEIARAAIEAEPSDMCDASFVGGAQPTHYCKVCNAMWRRWDDGSWNLRSKQCGKCCDNVAMGHQIAPMTHDGAHVTDGSAQKFAEALRPLAAQQAEPSEQFEHLDLQNHQLRRAMQKMMARLTELLDEDKFAEVEAIAKSAGVEPPIIESAQ